MRLWGNLWLRILLAAWDNIGDSGWMVAFVRHLRALRALLQPTASHALLQNLASLRADLGERRFRDFAFIQHSQYLTRQFGWRQRIHAANYHYRFVAQSHGGEFARQVYSDQGLTLWERRAGADHLRMALMPGLTGRLEGELSVVLSCNEVQIGLMSFAVVDGADFGLATRRPLLFISRNQTHRPNLREHAIDPSLRVSSPMYLCMAALEGLAQAYGMNQLLAIAHKDQLAYEPRHRASFLNSYEVFWAQYHARPVGQAFAIDLPLASTPLDQVKAKHRGRARQRRELGAEVSASARRMLARQLTQEQAQTELSPVWATA